MPSSAQTLLAAVTKLESIAKRLRTTDALLEKLKAGDKLTAKLSDFARLNPDGRHAAWVRIETGDAALEQYIDASVRELLPSLVEGYRRKLLTEKAEAHVAALKAAHAFVGAADG